jgi:hypothetical protein
MFEYYGGIDFSGAKEPLSNLWTAVGVEREGKLHVLSLCPHPFRADLRHFVAGGWRRALDVDGAARVLWGADFPFGLPAAAAGALGGGLHDWAAVLAWVADRPADEVREALPEHQRTRRRTDTGKAMPPFDIKLYRQTVEGLRWLHELREEMDGAVAVMPQAPGGDAASTLIEVYPSGTMVDLAFRCRRVPSRAGEVRARPAALRTFVTFEDASLEAIAVSLEDAWDATIACLSGFLARDDLDQPFRLSPAAEHAALRLEGWIYRPPAALG